MEAETLNETGPRWKHDCPNCRWLGRIERDDAYVCSASNNRHVPTMDSHSNRPTFFYRNSNYGSDHNGWDRFDLDAIGQTKKKAVALAISKGYMTEDGQFIPPASEPPVTPAVVEKLIAAAEERITARLSGHDKELENAAVHLFKLANRIAKVEDKGIAKLATPEAVERYKRPGDGLGRWWVEDGIVFTNTTDGGKFKSSYPIDGFRAAIASGELVPVEETPAEPPVTAAVVEQAIATLSQDWDRRFADYQAKVQEQLSGIRADIAAQPKPAAEPVEGKRYTRESATHCMWWVEDGRVVNALRDGSNKDFSIDYRTVDKFRAAIASRELVPVEETPAEKAQTEGERIAEKMVTKVKHTPTPWVIRDNNESRWKGTEVAVSYHNNLTPSGVAIITSADHTGRSVAPVDEGAANVQFILRACNTHDELVKACEDAAHEMIEIVQFATLENTPLRNQEVVSIGNVIARLQEALEHAKGE